MRKGLQRKTAVNQIKLKEQPGIFLTLPLNHLFCSRHYIGRIQMVFNQ